MGRLGMEAVDCVTFVLFICEVLPVLHILGFVLNRHARRGNVVVVSCMTSGPPGHYDGARLVASIQYLYTRYLDWVD